MDREDWGEAAHHPAGRTRLRGSVQRRDLRGGRASRWSGHVAAAGVSGTCPPHPDFKRRGRSGARDGLGRQRPLRPVAPAKDFQRRAAGAAGDAKPFTCLFTVSRGWAKFPAGGVFCNLTADPWRWAIGRRVAKRKWHELELVCSTGAGIAAIAPQVCGILREIVGADAAALFWMDPEGWPAGFFHEDSPAACRDLFANAYAELFVGPAEINVASLARKAGAPAGHLLAPPSQYWRSNTYNLLVRASGHHHTLDLRIDHEGRARAVVLLFRVHRRPFDGDDLALLGLSADLLRRAFAPTPGSDRWVPCGPPASLVVSADGETLLFATEAAQLLLQEGNLVAQGVPAEGPLRHPPALARSLCARLHHEARPRVSLDSASGRLAASAERLASPTGDPVALLTLQAEVPVRLSLVQRILAQDVSPKQKTILLAAASGATRAEAAVQASTTPEAMKKHLMAIFAATGTRSWTELGRMFTSA